MNASNSMNFFDIIFVICGLYMIYAAFDMKKCGIINTVVAGNKKDALQIRNREGYISYTFIRLIIIGVMMIVSAALDLAYLMTGLPVYFSYAATVLMLAALIYYIYMITKARRLFM